MATTIEILPPERVTPAPVAPVQQTVTVIDAPVSVRSGRRDANTNRGASCRAVLDTATFNGVLGGTPPTAPASAGTAPEPRPEKFPSAAAEELTPGESTGLLDAGQATRGSDAPPAPQQDVYRAATQRYARAFFSDTRTFARPGESLEISA